ncbi:MAG: methyl-accepting chemotaxis protein [Gemmatimonadota bacterium]
MTNTPARDPAVPLSFRPGRGGWPIALALGSWLLSVSFAQGLGSDTTSSSGTAVLFLLAAVALGAAVLVLVRTPEAAPAASFVGLASAAAALLALGPIDRPAAGNTLAAFLLTAPWHYLLTPVVVHFAFAIAWPHRKRYWFGMTLGWYVLHVALLFAATLGLVTSESELLAAVDETVHSGVLLPFGALVALVALMMGLATPDRRSAQRSAIAWSLAAVTLGFVPFALTPYLPDLGITLDGGMTPARLSLALLAFLGVIGVHSLPFINPVNRDLLAHRLGARLLDDREMADSLRALAESLRSTFEADGVGIRLAAPAIHVIAGELHDNPAAPFALEAETIDDRRTIVAPIGRSGEPLGEVRLEARFAGAFGRRERDWLSGFLLPIGVALRARQREMAADERTLGIAREVGAAVEALQAAAETLPNPPADDGMAVPPPVDAREVLAQLSDGVSGVVRNGEALMGMSRNARQHAVSTSDDIARALDGLALLTTEIERLTRHGDEIASSNDTVSGVAFRTNLLANNAALEAARAGVAGRTFGVLAEEISRLSDTTATTSADIGERISALAVDVQAIAAAVTSVRQALAAAIRASESTEEAARILGESSDQLEGAARSLRPAVDEASAVAKRRTARDLHLSATLDRLLDDRLLLARRLAEHREALERLTTTLGRLAARQGPRSRPVGVLGTRGF